jgi:hypothetical protein
VGDPVQHNLPRGRLGSLNSVPPRIAVQEDVQFRNLGNPAAIDFPAELNRELHCLSLPPIVESRACGDLASAHTACRTRSRPWWDPSRSPASIQLPSLS